MAWLRELVELHPLLWLVPLLVGPLLAAVGSRLSRRWMSLLALAGIGWTLVHAALAVVYLLWGPAGTAQTRLRFDFMTGDPLFALVFDLDLQGGWAVLLAAVMALGAQIHARFAVSRFTGRHRFFGLLLTMTGAGGFLFTAHSPAAVFIGWEGLALAGAFLYAFWESDERGARAGMRWLLFQRASGLLLLLGLLLIDLDRTLAASLLVAAACVRAGQFPWHGWIPASTQGTASATALVYGVGSALASVFLLGRAWGMIASTGFLPDVLGAVGAAGVLLGILAALQQQDPMKVIGWVYMLQTGMALLAFSAGDPAAANLVVTSEVLVLGGAVLACGGLAERVARFETAGGTSFGLRSRWAYLVLTLAWIGPPSLGFVGLGRLLGSMPHHTAGVLLLVLVGLASAGTGWLFQWIGQDASRREASSNGAASAWAFILPLVLWGLAFAAGIAALILFGPVGAGGGRGLVAAGLAAAGALCGWVIGWALARRRGARVAGRLTTTQRSMDRIAETGLGVGELVVQLPVVLARGLGVVIWRGLGDFVVDTLILGSAVRTVEGIGAALRYVQNGRIQRYTLVTLLAVLLLVWIMLG